MSKSRLAVSAVSVTSKLRRRDVRGEEPAGEADARILDVDADVVVVRGEGEGARDLVAEHAEDDVLAAEAREVRPCRNVERARLAADDELAHDVRRVRVALQRDRAGESEAGDPGHRGRAGRVERVLVVVADQQDEAGVA